MDAVSSKDVIAEVALGLFARRGFESVGVNEIAGMAGIAKPSLYYHFGSKDGLLEDIVRTHGDRLVAVTAAAAEYHHDLVMNLTALFDANINFASANQDFFRLLLRLFASAPETPGFTTGFTLRSRLIAIYTQLFAEAAGDHGNMRNRERIYAETFWGLVETCATLEVNGTLRIEPQIKYRIIHQYMHGIFS
jgi:TetR/AcrR family transcriptional regulator